MERLCSLLNPKRRSRKPSTAPSSPQLDPRPLVLSPEPRRSTATSLTTSMATPDVANAKTTNCAAPSTQTMATTSKTTHQAPNDAQSPSTAQQPELNDDEQLCSPKRLVYSMKQTSSLQNSKLRPRSLPTPSSSPQLYPQPLIPQPEPTAAPTSSAMPPAFPTAISSSTTMSTAKGSPHSPPTHPSQPQHAQTHAVSLPTIALDDKYQWLQKNKLAMTTPTPRPLHSPTQPTKSSMLPVSPLLDSKQAISPPPAHFDWATLLPTASSILP
ncbi:hypothetical protein L208DRAFT_1416384 [Tricholoma matsutake]|nr:hypothetical protein L208DRAFT_1416384 [Tricholoma matsutake 945]